MIEILNFVFQDFWHWLGTLILLIAICPWNKVHIRFGKDSNNAGEEDKHETD